MIRAVIIEDEEPCLLKFLEILKKHENISVVGFASNVFEAVEKIDSLKPDVIFLDINIPGGDGFSVLEDIKYAPFIIFVTAFDQFALKAFEKNSIDYIIKPVNSERVKKAIDKIENIYSIKNTQALSESNRDRIKSFIHENRKIKIKSSGNVYVIRLNEILYIKAEEKYTFVNINDNISLITDKSLKDYEKELCDEFIRIDRNLLVNKNKIISIKKDDNNKLIVKLENKDIFKVSLRMQIKLKEIFNTPEF